ncbi:MAG TPA: hypothetical protein VKA68_07725 [bacterium]|nr:hypothetical protein [bacterium]
MNRRKLITGIIVLVISTLWMSVLNAGNTRWMRVGNIQDAVDAAFSQTFQHDPHAFYYFDAFSEWNINRRATHILAREWTAPDGTELPVKKTSNAMYSDETDVTIPVPDENGIDIRKYYRNKPPEIYVDGVQLHREFPLDGEYLAPEEIPGTADRMIESTINTDMGLTITKRVLAWGQKNHDDYLIYDITFTNTGNVDLDDEIELPDQTLSDVYVARMTVDGGYGTWPKWHGFYGQYPGDSLRIGYSYHNWVTGDTWGSNGTEYDRYGNPDRDIGYIQDPEWVGEALLHADNSTTDQTDNWANQPWATGIFSAEDPIFKQAQPINPERLYGIMENGFSQDDGSAELTGAKPGHHKMPMELMDITYGYEIDMPYDEPGNTYVVGPYTVGPGESFRITFATVIGSISPRVAWDVGKDWLNGTATWSGPDKLPPPAADIYTDRPEFTSNDIAKDQWVSTGKDSLFRNVAAAQWAVENNYNVPTPPPAPSVEVQSLPDRIQITWGEESEEVADFAGYRVYRALGNPDPIVRENELIGEWNMVFECGEGTANDLTHTYNDAEAQRGEEYYYYVAAFDNGVDNPTGAFGTKESLESGRYLNMTQRAASLTRPPGDDLSEIRVVPNPFNVNASAVQFQGAPNKILFMELPPRCTISIYTESGDLVKVLEHTDGSGDEAWGETWQTFQVSETGQVVVSGLYIAHIKTPEGESTNVKFVIIR